MPIVLGGELRFASRPDPENDAAVPAGQPLVLQPGETGTLLAVAPLDEQKAVYVVMMGVTQHPKTTYTYIYDGSKRSLPAPLGTFINPLYTCRDLGAWIVCRSGFAIQLTNNDTEAHAYVGVIGYKVER